MANGYEVFGLTGGELLALLEALAREDWARMAELQLRVAVRRDTFSLFIPTGEEGPSRRRRQDAREYRNHVISKAQEILGQSEDRRTIAQQPAGMPERMADPRSAAALAAARSGQGGPPPPDGERMILVPDARDDAAPGLLAAALRRGRHAGLAASVDGDGREVAIVRGEDVAEDGGALAGLLARGKLPAGALALAPHVAGAFRLWLDHAAPAPADGLLGRLGAFMGAVRSGGGLPETCAEVALVKAGNGGWRLYVIDAPQETVAVAEIAARAEPAQPLSVDYLSLTAAPEALDDLQRRIVSLEERIGYQVSLRSMPSWPEADAELDAWARQIEELQERIADATALRAPQRHLLRFSQAQLPAMVDALRSLPQQAVAKGGAVKYAAGYVQGRRYPSHFLLYDPAEAYIRFGEARWRERTEDRPMGYWLDPHVAEAQVRQEDDRTRVYVPWGQTLVPSLGSFGGPLDEVLRLILGDFFTKDAEVLKDPASSPLFVFTPIARGSRDMTVEVLDERDFRDLRLQLPWINDHVTTEHPPGGLDRALLERAARTFYSGEAADELVRVVAGNVEGLRLAWQDALAAVERECSALLSALVGEMAAACERIALIDAHLHAAERRMVEGERLLTTAEAALRRGGGIGAELELKDRALRAARTQFQARILAETESGEAAMAAAENRIAALRARLDRLHRWRDR